MKIIEIAELENGAHRNQELFGTEFPEVPEGWAVVPEDMEIPETYPFVHIEAENGVVTAMTAGELPEPGPEITQLPTEQEQMRADIDYLAAMQGVTL